MGYDSNAVEIARVNSVLKNYQKPLTDIGRKTRKFSETTQSTFLKATSAVGSFAESIGRGLANKAKQTVFSLEGLGKSSNSVSKSVLELSNMLRPTLIRMIVRMAIQGAGEGMRNLVQYSDHADQPMSGLMVSMTHPKSNFAAAFAPVLLYVVPISNTLINLLATAVGCINQSLSVLGGGSIYIRARKANEDYATSLKKTGGAASKVGKDTREALAPLDDLVQIQQQGADVSGGGGGGVSPSDIFEAVGIDKGINDLANKLKEMFTVGDWGGTGKLIGKKISETVQKFTEFISWDNVGARIAAFITMFTAMLSSLIATTDWYVIGTMMETGISTLASTLCLLLTQIDWPMLGNALSQSLMGMADTVGWDPVGTTIGAYFQAQIPGPLGFIIGMGWGAIRAALATCLIGIIGAIDWGQFGYLMAAGLNGAFALPLKFASAFDWTEFSNNVATSISSFFQTFQWTQAGETLSTFVVGIFDLLITVVRQMDWASFVQGIVNCIEVMDQTSLTGKIYTLLYSAPGVASGALANFISTLMADGSTKAKDYFNGKIEECGGNIWERMLKGIVDAAKGVVSQVKTSVTDPFISGVEVGFGTHSSSTVMAGIGQYLWEGFRRDVKKFLSGPGALIKANITGPSVNGIKSLLGTHSPSTALASISSNAMAEFSQGVTNKQTASQNAVQSWTSGVASWFSNKSGISTGDSTEARQWATSVLSGFNNSISKNYTKSQTVIQIWAENAWKWFVDADETQGVNELSRTKSVDLIIQAFKVKIEGSRTETQASVEAWAKSVREWFWEDSNPEGTGGTYTAFYNIARRINEGPANGVSDFTYMAKNAIRKWARETMGAAEEKFSINPPFKELHSIAEYVVRGFNDGISATASSSRSTVQKWLGSVLDVFNGVDVQLPIGISIPNVTSYLPRMASGTTVPSRAGGVSSSIRNMADYDQEEAMGYLIGEMEEVISRLRVGKDKSVQTVLNLIESLAALTRVPRPGLDKETARKDVSPVIVGG